MHRWAALVAALFVIVGLTSSAAYGMPEPGQSTQAEQEQVLTWTAGDDYTQYLSAPSSAVAGQATIVFENSAATGNTTGMPHTLTFVTNDPDYNSDVSLNLTASPNDANGGKATAQVTLTPGRYLYHCTMPGHQMMQGVLVVTDGSGGGDTTAPETSAAVTGEQNTDGDFVGSATVTVSATDSGSGVDTVEYALDGGSFQPYTSPVVVDTVGSHTLSYRATDKDGNAATEKSVDFTVVAPPTSDDTPPQTSATVSGDKDADGNYVDMATVTVSASDTGSGVNAVEYSLDGAEFQPYSAPVTVHEAGEHDFRYRATDKAGNTADTKSVGFTVVAKAPADDTTPPEASAKVEGDKNADGAYVGSVKVTLSATDADSGVDTIEYSLDGAPYLTYDQPLVIDEAGAHSMRYRATDKAGNTSMLRQEDFTVVAQDGGEPGPTCPEQDDRETVVVGDVDSGVPDRVTADGCTINELIEDHKHWKNHGTFVEHLKKLTGALHKDGVIDARERRAIDKAGATSDVGKPGHDGGDQDDATVKVLVFHGPAAKQDDPVAKATAAVEKLGKKNGFAVDESDDPGVFTVEKLSDYRGVVFLSAKGVKLSAGQEAAFKAYIQSGGGFVGVHDAARALSDSKWFTGLIGTRPATALSNPEKVGEIEASGENPPNEGKEELFDNDNNTKWLTFETTGWVSGKLDEPVAVDHYAMTSANDHDGRDPKDWTLQGSQDGENWTDLDKQSGQNFTARFQTKQYTIDNTTEYAYYRLNVTANNGEDLTQLAELRLFGPKTGPPPENKVQEAVVDVTDRHHPANKGLPLKWTRSDQWLNWDPNPIGKVQTIAQVEEKTYDAGQGGNGPFHPISWCRDYDGGRSFYTGMGRTEASYTTDEKFQSHLLGAIEWATGMVRGDCQATFASNYKIERLTAENQPGQLDQIGEPHGLTIAPDGKVFYIGKAACPSGPIKDWDNPKVGLGCGTIHQWDPDTEKVKLLTTLDVMGNRGSGDELVKNEEGLVGITLDPKFEENGWIYIYWMPHESIDRDKQIGQRTVSRLTYDFDKQDIDKSTRKDLLHWDAQIHSCCHAGGGMTFDEDGNLYIGVGDNNSSGGSKGYSGNNWTKDYKGLSFQDARRTAGNTNNLNGKILRIHPEPDGTYTIPEGNLFTGKEAGGGKTRPEIYVMGVRNVARIAWDKENNWLTAGWVGPDAGAPDPELGPAKYETATIITSAGNQGWPYCMGNRQPYRDRSNKDASVLTGWYDCDNLKNTSPRNTGLVNIPPARNNMIWYSPQGGGVTYPEHEDGSGLPTYKEEDAKYTEPYFRGGCQAIMDGPTYHRSLVDTDSGVAWPEYWDNKWFIGDECNPNNRVAVTVDPDNVKEQGPPAFGESLRQIIRSGGGDNELQSWMDAKFGPDGALYMLDYAGGFFSLDDNQKLIRITYEGGPATPNPSDASGRVLRQSEPKTLAFSSAKAGGVSWEWDFGDGSKPSHEANPTHTYADFGTYHVKLKVTYADGTTSTGKFDVQAGCDAPDARSSVWMLDTDTGVANHEVGGGCTVNDLIADERAWAEHGGFVSHVSNLVKQFRADGYLDRKEAAKLKKAAAKSEIGKKGTTAYQTIFDGSAASLADWSQAGAGSFHVQPDGTMRSSGGMGMLWYSKKKFADFSVKLQFRDVAPKGHRANSGLFVRFPDPTTPLAERPEGSCGTIGAARTAPEWVAIYCGQEVQIYDGDSGEPQKTGSIYNFKPVELEDAGVTDKGQWNNYEIRVVGQHYTIIRNGEVINEFDNTPGKESSRNGDPSTDLRQFASGFVGLQNHSDNDLIEFRNIRVRQL
jgi:type 1 glutamine amidotransferase